MHKFIFSPSLPPFLFPTLSDHPKTAGAIATQVSILSAEGNKLTDV